MGVSVSDQAVPMEDGLIFERRGCVRVPRPHAFFISMLVIGPPSPRAAIAEYYLFLRPALPTSLISLFPRRPSTSLLSTLVIPGTIPGIIPGSGSGTGHDWIDGHRCLVE
jgi:hypothetical protein